ncbi:MAG: hypothetical protein ACK4OP_06140, partial [Gemmobacter sp.]
MTAVYGASKRLLCRSTIGAQAVAPRWPERRWTARCSVHSFRAMAQAPISVTNDGDSAPPYAVHAS